MEYDPDEKGDVEHGFEGEEPTRAVSETDLNEDGFVDPVEAAVSQLDDDVGEQAGDAAEVLVEVQRPAPNADRSVTAAYPKRSWITRFLPRTRREQQIQALQAGYTEMLDMMRSISTHLERQSDVQSGLLGALEHFPDAVDSLRNVGKATQQQTEMLELVKHRLESSASHEQQVVDSMNRFNNTLTMMDDTSRATADTIGSLVDRSHESERTMRAMLERSERRTTLLLGFLGLLTIGAIAAALYFGVTGQTLDLGASGGAGGETSEAAAAVKGDDSRLEETTLTTLSSETSAEIHVTAQDAVDEAGRRSHAEDHVAVPLLHEGVARTADGVPPSEENEESTGTGEGSDAEIKNIVSVLAGSGESTDLPEVTVEPVE